MGQKVPDAHLLPANAPGEPPMHSVQSEQYNYIVDKFFGLSCGCFQKEECNTQHEPCQHETSSI